jgi:general secretion pathway protein K
VVGLISLLVLSIIWTARMRVQATSNIIQAAKAETLADAGVALAKLTVVSAVIDRRLSTIAGTVAGRPTICAMPDREFAAIVTEYEVGKVDINAAPTETLVRLLEGVGSTANATREIAARISEFSRVNMVTGDPGRHGADIDQAGNLLPKRGPFETILELDQVPGMKRNLFEALLPHVTVYSRQPEVDPALASPALISALSGSQLPGTHARDRQLGINSAADPRGSRHRSLLAGDNLLIHVEVYSPSGSAFVREENIEVVNGPFPIRTVEWRRGRSRRFGALLSYARGSLVDCEGLVR